MAKPVQSSPAHVMYNEGTPLVLIVVNSTCANYRANLMINLLTALAKGNLICANSSSLVTTYSVENTSTKLWSSRSLHNPQEEIIIPQKQHVPKPSENSLCNAWKILYNILSPQKGELCEIPLHVAANIPLVFKRTKRKHFDPIAHSFNLLVFKGKDKLLDHTIYPPFVFLAFWCSYEKNDCQHVRLHHPTNSCSFNLLVFK